MREVNTRDLKVHALAYLIPPMRDDEWRGFLVDIASNGIRVPLEVLADGTTVVDGAHRLRAAQQLKKERVPVVDAPLNGDSPEVYMLKAAVLRRHLTDDQRATMAAKWKEMNKKEPELGERDEKGRFKPSAPHGAEGGDVSPTRAEAVKIFKVGRKKVDKATTLMQRSPELFEAVHSGKKTLTEATREARIEDARMAPKFQRLKELEERGVFIGSVWDYGPRANYAGDPNFHGNCIPQVVENAILFYTHEGDIVLDPMAGSGTTFDVCARLNRRCLVYDIKSVRGDIPEGDARDLKDEVESESVDFVFLHPPYWKLVTYTKANEEQSKSDISRLDYDQFINAMGEVFAECHRVLKGGRVLCLLIGDLVTEGKFTPIAIPLYNLVASLMTPIGIAIKTTEGSKSQVLKGKTVWAEVAYTQNLKIQHDFVMLFSKHGKQE